MKPRKLVFLLCCVVFGSVAIHLSTSRPAVIAAQSRAIQIVTSSGSAGGTVAVPVELVSQGDENAIGFSLTFDAAVLSNPTAALGTGATGATLNTNNSQSAQGRFGVALAFPANQKFVAGVRQMVVVTFSIAANASFGTTNINFGDQPVLREVADVTANALTAIYTGGSVSIFKGYEADVAPRPDGDGNGTITITDWVQVGKFVAGLDTAANGSEFQRADCAPRSTLGDGRISIIDWTQAGRYAAALDPATLAGGPTTASSSVVGGRWSVVGGELVQHQPSTVRAQLKPTTDNRQPTTISVDIEATGIENALGFSLIFNASHWRLISVKAGRDADDALLHINSNEADRGRIGVALAMPVGRAIARGERELVVCEFAPIANRKGLPLMFDFSHSPVRREIADVDANPVMGSYSVEGLEASTIEAAPADVFGSKQLLVILGTDLAASAEFTSSTELLSLAGTSVTVIDSSGQQFDANVFEVSPDRVDCLIPTLVAKGAATVILTNSIGYTYRKLIEITRR